MARREKLHKKLAEAISRWLPGCTSPLILRKSITRDDLATSFQVRLETTVTLADWESAIEISKLSQPRRPDPRLALKIHQVEEILKHPRLAPADRQHWSDQLAQLKASH